MENVQQNGTSLPKIGDKAPDFNIETTHGMISRDDYKGKWFILFSHPSDFTPVCTTEFMAFQRIAPELKKLNTELLGLSIDSIHSHIAWVRNIEKNFNVTIDFPIIADLNKEVAEAYGMVMPEAKSTETSRAVFIVDAEQIVRTVIYYPLSTGRNMDEILRVVKALQTADEHGVATPADWQPEDKVIVKPPRTQQEAKEREESPEYEVTDWYFSKKSL
jgi:peroxiredoxin 2/4